jgi:hypothetical protein
MHEDRGSGVEGDAAAYGYRPSLLGAPVELRLSGDAIDWKAGSKAGRVPLRNVRRVNMSYNPASMQPHRFVTRLWAEEAPRLDIVSTSWRSMMEQERLDARYASFVRELHRRLAAAAPAARFVRGKNPWLYWPGLVLFVAVTLGLVAIVPRTLQSHSVVGALIVAVFLGLFLWQGVSFFRRNRPGRYRPDALPPDLLPKGGRS